jgi:hypothetical protein
MPSRGWHRPQAAGGAAAAADADADAEEAKAPESQAPRATQVEQVKQVKLGQLAALEREDGKLKRQEAADERKRTAVEEQVPPP